MSGLAHARRQGPLRRLRPGLRLGPGHPLAVLHHRPHAQHRPAQGRLGSRDGRHPVHRRLSGRPLPRHAGLSGGIFSPGLPKTSAPYWMLMRLSMVLGSFTAWPAHAVQGVVGWSTASSRSSAFEADLRRIRAPRARNRSHPTRSPLSGTRRRVQERRGGWLNAGSSSASPPSGKNRPGGHRSIAKTFA